MADCGPHGGSRPAGDRTLAWFANTEARRDLAAILIIVVFAIAMTSLLSALGIGVPRVGPLEFVVANSLVVLLVASVAARHLILRIGLGADRVVIRMPLRVRVIQREDVERAFFEPPSTVLHIEYRGGSRAPTSLIDLSVEMKRRIARVLDPERNPENPLEAARVQSVSD